jgi:hypothetical protein
MKAINEDIDGLSIHAYKSNKAKLKQPIACQNDILPRLHCSYLITGKSGSGKSTTVLHLLNSKSLLKGAFDIILYLSDSPDDLFKENLKIPEENFIKNMSEEWLQKLIEKQKNEVEKKGITKAKSICLIFDDILSKQKFLRSNILKKLVCECRHYNISCIFNTQGYKSIPRVVRINCRGLILFPSSLNEMIKFAEENCLANMSNKRFLKLIQYCTNEPYQFCFINHDAPQQDKLRKNFNIIIN